ncbi:MAG: hypothetical protein LLF94_04500, partial [Chlamydiales bacterium]|nr:hypothetical protein [Chlamydiales bacterium]
LRQARSWKTVDKMLDTVETTNDNQTWKRSLRKIVAMMLLYGQKLKDREDDTATIFKEIEQCFKDLDALATGEIPQDCKQIDSYIKIHKHSLLLFAHMNEVKPMDDAVFLEILPSTAKTTFLPDTIRGSYQVREVKVEEAVDKNDATIVYKQAKCITYIGNNLTYPNYAFSEEELDKLYNVYSTVYAALNSAIEATNQELLSK